MDGEGVNMDERNESNHDYSYSIGYKPQTAICESGFIFDQQSEDCIGKNNTTKLMSFLTQFSTNL